MVVGPLQLDEHVLVGGVVADTADEAGARDILALEGCQIDLTRASSAATYVARARDYARNHKSRENSDR